MRKMGKKWCKIILFFWFWLKKEQSVSVCGARFLKGITLFFIRRNPIEKKCIPLEANVNA